MHWASMRGHTCILRLLQRHDAALSAMDTNARLPLHYAANKGHYDAVTYLLQVAPHAVNERDREYATPMHLACKNGHGKLIGLLMSNGGDIYLKMNNGATPLHVACQAGGDLAVRRLLVFGADRNATDDDRFTPLHRAAERNHVGCLRLLLTDPGQGAAGPPRLGPGSPGSGPLGSGLLGPKQHTSGSEKQWSPSPEPGPFGTNPSDSGSRTPSPMRVNHKGKDGRSALTLACKAGFTDTAELLIQHNASVDILDIGKRTPIHWSLFNGHIQTSVMLLEQGSDPHRKDKSGESPLELGIHNHKLSKPQRRALKEFVEDPEICLMKICRRTIRAELGADVRAKLDALVLPTRMKRFLCYNDVPL